MNIDNNDNDNKIFMIQKINKNINIYLIKSYLYKNGF